MKMHKAHGGDYTTRTFPQFLIGIDEVGRGPLAGPVSVGAVAVLAENYRSSILADIKNSKALSPKSREKWFSYLDNERKEGRIFFAVASVSHTNVDRWGIVHSINRALEGALGKLFLPPQESFVYLDGGLYAPLQYKNQRTIIKGDELEPIIAAASIVAKVTRDERMKRMALIYPEYGFEIHKGYGTPFHMAKLALHGPSPIHRKTFLGSIVS